MNTPLLYQLIDAYPQVFLVAFILFMLAYLSKGNAK